jgi:transcriptional regulator with XRE-family HTH domain
VAPRRWYKGNYQTYCCEFAASSTKEIGRTGSSAAPLSLTTISRTQIANYESGRKKNLDIAELLILAAALDVPPLVLLYPDLPAGKVEIIPDRPGTSSGSRPAA